MFGERWFALYASPLRIYEIKSRGELRVVREELEKAGHDRHLIVHAKRKDRDRVRKELRESQRRMNHKHN
jgi:hypothetical protein